MKIDLTLEVFTFRIETKITVVSENEITEQTIRAAIKVHKALGPGYSNPHMKLACTMRFFRAVFLSSVKRQFLSYMQK